MKIINAIKEKSSGSTLRVAAYCRVSTDHEDQMVSLENQKAHFQQYINSHPDWILVGMYFESGRTATRSDNRPELQRLLKDCHAKKIDLIITKSISRLSRNTTDCLSIVRMLRDLHVDVYFEKENINTGCMEGELFLSILSSMAEDESRSISENSRWSVKKRFQEGKYKFSRAPYGYTLKDGMLEIDPSEALIVRRIFDDVIEGLGSPAIAASLNAQLISPKRGTTWHSGTILHMISNEIYAGDLRMQKTYRDNGYRPRLNHGEKDLYYMKDHHPAIISRDIFDAANKAVKSRDRIQETSSRQNRYCFTGKLICTFCGSPLVRKYKKRAGKNMPGWICREHVKNAASCGGKWISEEFLWAATGSLFSLLSGKKKSLVEKYITNFLQSQDIRLALLDHKLFYEHPHDVQDDPEFRKTKLREQKKSLVKANETFMKIRELQEYLQTHPKPRTSVSERESAFNNHIQLVFINEASLCFQFYCGLVALIVKVVVSKKLKSFVALGSSCLSSSTMNRISCK